MRNRFWFRDRHQEWYEQQDKDNKWIEENTMPKYTEVFSGWMNDNSEGQQKNKNAPKYRSSGSGKSAIVATHDIPAGSIIALAAWGSKGQYGPQIQIKGQLVEPDHMPQQTQTNEAQPQEQEKPDFDDDIPF